MRLKASIAAFVIFITAAFTAYDFRDSYSPKALCERGIVNFPLLPTYQGWMMTRQGECVQFGPQRDYNGLVILTDEAADFVPNAQFEERFCKSNDAWTFEAGSEVVGREIARLKERGVSQSPEYSVYAVTVRGRRTVEPGTFGHLDAYPHLLLIDAVTSAAPEPPNTPQPWPCDVR